VAIEGAGGRSALRGESIMATEFDDGQESDFIFFIDFSFQSREGVIL
jgi:hypothetical protein